MISCLNSFSQENIFCIDPIIDDVSVYLKKISMIKRNGKIYKPRF